MGGIGSGNRWSTTAKLEEIKRIDIRWLKQNNMLRPYTSGRLTWSSGGEQSGNINYEMYPAAMVLNYSYRSYPNTNRTPVKQRVQLVETDCHLGGKRKWFACPKCSQRVAVLYGASVHFECRKCTGLNYSSQSECYTARLVRKRDKLAERIFDTERSYSRKKGMHTKKFERLFDQWLITDNKAETALLASLLPLLERASNLTE